MNTSNISQNLLGSLNSLAHPKSLEITSADEKQHHPLKVDLDRVFPWESANTLTSVKFTDATVDVDHFNLPRRRNLRQFMHGECEADSLWASNGITDCFKSLNNPYLETDECYTELPDPLLCLSRLQSLPLRTRHDYEITISDEFTNTCMDVLVAITDNLHY